jgi:hypothetical protein
LLLHKLRSPNYEEGINIKTTFGWFYFVGLPDKLDIRPLTRDDLLSVQPTLHLPMPYQNQLIPHDSKFLGAYATPDLARLMSLFLLLF